MTLTPEIIAGLSSFAGALLFFGAGFFMARLRSRPASDDVSEIAPAGDSGTREDLLEEVNRELASAQDQYRSVQRENQELERANAKLSADNKAFVAAARNRFLKMKKQLDEAVSESVSLKARIEELREHSASSDTVTEEMLMESSSLKEALTQAEKETAELTARLSELENTNHELMIKARKLDEQSEELDALRAESGQLKSRLAEMHSLQEELEGLQNENARLLSMGIVLQEPPREPVLAPSIDGIGGASQKLVSHLSQEKTSRGVVMADELGLPIAGTGEHVEAMAAMAAIFSTVSSRIESMLPFGLTRSMTIKNTDDLTITLQPVDIDPDRVIVCSLSVGPGPSRDQVLTLLEEDAAD